MKLERILPAIAALFVGLPDPAAQTGRTLTVEAAPTEDPRVYSLARTLLSEGLQVSLLRRAEPSSARYYVQAGSTATGNFDDFELLGRLLGIEEAAPLEEDSPLEGDPEALALYGEMVAAMRRAETLHWVSDYRWEAGGDEIGHAEYEIWLAKPNYARIEARAVGEADRRGVLIGDGDHFWIHWPTGKPRYGFEHEGEYAEAYERNRDRSYMKSVTPLGRHSIGHEVGSLGVGLSMTILDPSTFHGYTDSLQPYLDGAYSRGTETIDDQECDLIEVSFMMGQRTWLLWLACGDHLPRRLRETVHVHEDIVTHETWTRLTRDEELPPELFQWQVPEGWVEWRLPAIEEGLLEPGTPAPDFELTSITGGKIKLSDYRGKAIWINKWRCG